PTLSACPSPTRRTSSSTSSLPTAAASFSILSFSPAETRYCLPPVLTTAYMLVSEIAFEKHEIIHTFSGCGQRNYVILLTRRSVDSAVRQSPLQPELLRKLIAADMLAVDAMIRRRLESDVVLVRRIAEYIIAGGGKRLRPALVFL